MSGIGHNQGPTMEPGHTWRTYHWRQAQKKLMPKTIPLMVLKMRLKRAAELGMDYKTYASIRHGTGRDVCGLLFSSNALRISAGDPAMPPERRYQLEQLRDAQRLALIHLPVPLERAHQANPLDPVARAPDLLMSWHSTADALRAFVSERRLVGDQVVIVGDTALERDWTTAARAAGYVSAEQYFNAA